MTIHLFRAVLALQLLVGTTHAYAAEAKSSWQVEWEKLVKAAEGEGEVNVYVVDYPRFAVSQFQKAFPKIKLNMIDGPSGPALSSRLMAERRAGKYQADLYIAGQGTHVSVLYPAKALAPMPAAFILPEVKDESKWFKGKHRFVDPETRHSFVFQGHRGLYVSYNTGQVKAVYQVPADNRNTWRYDFFFKWSRPFSKEDSSKRDFVDASYKKLRNQRNNYLQDRERQKTVNFTGITEFLNQDACATESMGAIVDRSKEHVGASDAFILQVRRFLLRAVKDVQAGKLPPGLIFEREQNDLAHLRCEAAHLPAGVSWRSLYE